MNLLRGKLVPLSCLVLVCMVFSGCWDAEDPERTAHVVAIGVDRGNTRALWVTFQIMVPSMLAGGAGAGAAGGGGGGGGSADAPRVWVRGVETEGVSEAFHLLCEYLPRTPALSHLQAVVTSEQVARDMGVASLWDFLTRDVQARRAAQFIVTPGRAEEVLRFQPRLADIPGAGLVALLELAADTGATIATPAGRFGVALHAEGMQPVAAMVEIVPPEAQALPGGQSGSTDRAGGQADGRTTAAPGTVPPTPEVRAAGLAVFRGDRMVGALPQNESLAVSLMLRRARRPLIRATAPDSGALITARVLSCRPEIKLMTEGGQLRGQMRLRVSAELREELTPAYFIEPARLKQLERALAAALTQDLASALRRTQEMGADVFGFGWWLYRKRPQQWFAVREHWDKIYGHLPVDVQVEVKLRSEGLTIKSPLFPGTPGGDR
ncbi:MAG: Ger(x)C family spore germination protein [Bacillota bacterium]|nr:Ger(x)C family spore germination protein [Bacillota bacterium]